jgi:antitoxin MazE
VLESVTVVPKAKVVKCGNSLAVAIPKAVAEQARLQEGDLIEIEALEGRIELRRAARTLTLEELVAQITPENRHGETAWGPDVGKEVIEW